MNDRAITSAVPVEMPLLVKRSRDKLFLLLSILMGSSALAWGTYCTVIGMRTVALIPLGFVGITVSLAVLYVAYDLRMTAMRAMLLCSIAAPLLFQSAIGGLEGSGMVMLWSLVGLVAAVNLERSGKKFIWLVIVLALLGWYAASDPLLPLNRGERSSALPAPSSLLTFNLTVVLGTCFVLADQLLREQRNMRLRVMDIQRTREQRYTEELALRNQEIQDSLAYARRIQVSTWPDLGALPELLEDHFVIDRPKDAVGGDLFWHGRAGDKSYLVLMDCTGHGVPGSLVSMLCQGLISEVVYEGGGIGPVEVIRLTQRLLDIRLNRQRTGNADGAEMAVLCFDHRTDRVSFAGLGCGLTLAHGSQVETVRGQRSMPYLNTTGDERIQEVRLQIQPGTRLYLHTDGIVDQFCRNNKRKLSRRRLEEMIAKVAEAPLAEQRRLLLRAFDDWKGGNAQVDDLMVLGLQLAESWVEAGMEQDSRTEAA